MIRSLDHALFRRLCHSWQGDLQQDGAQNAQEAFALACGHECRGFTVFIPA